MHVVCSRPSKVFQSGGKFNDYYTKNCSMAKSSNINRITCTNSTGIHCDMILVFKVALCCLTAIIIIIIIINSSHISVSGRNFSKLTFAVCGRSFNGVSDNVFDAWHFGSSILYSVPLFSVQQLCTSLRNTQSLMRFTTFCYNVGIMQNRKKRSDQI